MMHFLIGIIFALIYVYAIAGLLTSISNYLLKGLIFGLIAFIIVQIAMPVMRNIMKMSPPEGEMLPMAVASLAGHLVFGIVVVMVAKR